MLTAAPQPCVLLLWPIPHAAVQRLAEGAKTQNTASAGGRVMEHLQALTRPEEGA